MEIEGNKKIFNEILKNEFLKKCKKNEQFGLRSFAKYLDVDPSHLSKVLNGKTQFSSKKIYSICKKLKLDPTNLYDSTEKFTTIEEYDVLTDWYFHTIFELMKLDEFQTDLNWIASRLGISKLETKMAIDKLLSLKIIEIKDDGNWMYCGQKNTTTIIPSKQFTSKILKDHQSRLLEKSKDSLEQVPIEFRSHSAMTIAIDKNLIPQAKKLIIEFQRKIDQLISQDAKTKNEVYTLGVSFFPMTKINNKENRNE